MLLLITYRKNILKFICALLLKNVSMKFLMCFSTNQCIFENIYMDSKAEGSEARIYTKGPLNNQALEKDLFLKIPVF